MGIMGDFEGWKSCNKRYATVIIDANDYAAVIIEKLKQLMVTIFIIVTPDFRACPLGSILYLLGVNYKENHEKHPKPIYFEGKYFTFS